MRLIGTVARPSSISFASLDFETAMSRSNCGVSSSRVWRSAADRTRLEWAVRDQVRAALASLAQRDHRARGDRLGAVHVGVDDVGADLREVSRQRADGDRVIRVLDDQHGDPRPLELADGAARRQRDDRHVVARRVEPGDQREEVLLGAAVGAGREDLDDADAAPAGDVRPLERGQARIPGHRCAHVSRSFAGRAVAGSGSSTAPHAYLYDSLPRRKSSRRTPAARARAIRL